MVDIYVLNGDLKPIGIIDAYTSLLWVNRYDEEGDCELYIQATSENLELLKEGNYLSRLDDEMVCRIEKIELDTDAENGDYIIATGYDAKKILGQRVIWGTVTADGNAEEYIRNIVDKNLINTSAMSRQIRNSSGKPNFFLGDKAGFTQVISQQASFQKINEKVQEICKMYGWGYKVVVVDENFYFQLYQGKDRSDSVIFADDFENLISTKYIQDYSNIANVALVAGEGEGSDRAQNVSGYAESINRNEIYVDARDLSRTISWEDLTTMYPAEEQGGEGYILVSEDQQTATYNMRIIDIVIVDENQLMQLEKEYPSGHLVIKEDGKYYEAYNIPIADLQIEKVINDEMKENDSVTLRDIVYLPYLLSRGYEKLSEYKKTTSFEGSIEPNVSFVYKHDYYLGDKVTVRNEYGIEAVARIVEIMETYDDTGSRIEPKFEYIEDNDEQPEVEGAYLLTEDSQYISTENNELIEIEYKNEPLQIALTSQSPTVASKKITELVEADELSDDSCIAVVSQGETKKFFYRNLKQQLLNEFEAISNEEIDLICV